MSLKEKLLEASQVPTGKSSFAGVEIEIRGLTSSEDLKFADEGFTANAIAICAACIVEDGKPVFTEAELGEAKSGILKPILIDILKISFPDAGETEKN
ncbi:MAG: hypothetical protein ABJC88_16735 [Parasphingorhabdus sp.]|uniref:hypothetical protein n=1 Tax=Sphingomonadales TaxID=204457 RepID=UPI0032633866